MPYFLVNGKTIFDQLHEPKFHLLAVSNGHDDHEFLKTELERKYAELVDFSVIPLDREVVEIFGSSKSFNVLLRPDNHIGAITTETTLSGLKLYLNAFIKH